MQSSPMTNRVGRHGEARAGADAEAASAAPLSSWSLRSGTDAVRCALHAADGGVHLRIESNTSITISQRFPNLEQADAMSSAWRAVFESRGWTEDAGSVRVAPKADRRQTAAG